MYKYKLLATLAAVILLIGYESGQAQWQQISGLYGEQIKSVRATPTRLFALSQSGAFRSDNNGTSWINISASFSGSLVERLSVSGDTVMIYAQPDSYISIDNGNNWDTVNMPVGVFLSSDVASGGGKIYMSTFGDYFYTSVNSGLSWTQVTAGLTTPITACIATEGTTVYVGTDNGIFKSVNSGTSFVPSGLAGELVLRIYSKSPYVFAYTGTNVYKSDDDGASWQNFQPAIGFTDITDFLVHGTEVYATTTGDLISSGLAAPNWQPDTVAPGVTITNGICNKDNSIYLGCNRGVFASADSGLTWNGVSTGIIPVAISALAETPGDTLFAGASTYGISFYDGSNWNFSGLENLNSNGMYSDASGVYTASDLGIYRTTDGGANWQLISNTPANPLIAFCADVTVADSVIIGAALQMGVLRSGDYGNTWALVDAGLQGTQSGCITSSGNNIIVGTYNNGLFTSTDGGLNWTQSGAPGEAINDVAALGNYVYAASLSPNGNFLSTDGGLTWINSGTTYFDRLSAKDSFMVGSSDSYIELSRDSGQTFQFNTPGPTGSYILSNQATGNGIYIGTAFEGVWEITFSEVMGAGEQAALSQTCYVYPGIFSQSATLIVSENITKRKPSLDIYDISGQSVQHSVIYNLRTSISAEGLANGMYFFKLHSGNEEFGRGKFIVQK